MNPRIKKWIIRPLLTGLISIVALVSIGALLLVMEQQRLVDDVLVQLNKQFKGELTVEKSSISPLKHFPYISVALHQAKFYADKTRSGRPILDAEKLYIGFSLPDIFRQKYNIRKVSLHGGYIELIRENDGTLNLLAAEGYRADTTKSTSAKAGFEIALQKLLIQDVTVSYLDRATERKSAIHIDKVNAAFQFDGRKLAFGIDGDMELDVTVPGDTSSFRHKKIYVDLKANYRTDKKRLDITSGAFKFEEASFAVEGSAKFLEQFDVDFWIKGAEPNLGLLTAFLPGEVKARLKPFQYDGRVYFEGIVKGIISKDELPLVDVSFGCQDGWFLNKSAGKKIDQLAFKGRYTNGTEHSLHTSELHITEINARPEKGVFKGNFVLRDFNDPHSLVQINSELELKFVGDFLGIRDLQQITGKIKLDMDFKELNNIVLPEQSLNKLREGIQSSLRVEGLSFTVPGYPYAIRDMNLQAEMKDGRITVDSASLKVGSSDLRLSGSISDIHGFLHDRDKIITLGLNVSSGKIALRDVFAYDTAHAQKMKEEIRGFNISLLLETSVQQLLSPSPLPKGKFEMKNLRASFKGYPHTFRNVSAILIIADTTLQLRNFTGMADQSDLKLTGQVQNYPLWFEGIKKGRTQIAFDFKANRLAMQDFLGPVSRKFIPEGYRKEEANNVWLSAKVNLRYDTVFKFAKAHIDNITGTLKNHDIKLKDIQGNIKYGTNRVLVLDTLKGNIGKSDFDITLHVFAGVDKNMKKRTNYLQFHSKFIDLDELTNYDLSTSTTPVIGSSAATARPDSSRHAKAFNIFMIPFLDFKAEIDIAKIRYSKLWLKDVAARLRMQEDHVIYIDTVGMQVADGTVGVKGHLDGKDPSQIYFRSTIDIAQVDLEKMLIKLDHFGQDVVVNKNLKGHLSGRIVSDVLVHPNLVPQVNKTKAEMNVIIYNGSLNDFAPMQAMASYFKDKNLRMVRFDTLRNTLTFTNGVLNIPSMDINSSLGYIQMSGKQSMDLSMEYYVRVPMKLVTKAGFNSLFDKKPEDVDINQVDEIDYSEKDKKVRFMNLKVTGKPEDFKVGLGKDKSRN